MYFHAGLKLHTLRRAATWSAICQLMLVQIVRHSIFEFIRFKLPPRASKVVGWYLTATAWTMWIQLVRLI